MAYKKYIKYFPAVLFLAISLPETLENLQVWSTWLETLRQLPWLNNVLFGLGIIMLIVFLIMDVSTYRKGKPERKANIDREEDSKQYLFLREKLSPEQLLEFERERSKQAVELEKDKRDKNMTHFVLIVFAILVVVIIRSCG